MEIHRLLSSLGVLILAAGKGTRMYSDTPKVLQRLLGAPMLSYVYRTAKSLAGDGVWTVIGHGAEQVAATFSQENARFILQKEQKGTGHALQVAWPVLQAAGVEYLLVINGDTPMADPVELRAFVNNSLKDKADIAFISMELKDPGAYGRVVRKKERIAGIVEAKDYAADTYGPEPKEINAGIYFFTLSAIKDLLPQLSNNNKSGEFYITDLVSLGLSAGLQVEGYCFPENENLFGVNTPYELVQCEERLCRNLIVSHQQRGVFIRNPLGVRIGPEVSIAPGADITGPCSIYGKTVIGAGASIASYTAIFDSVIEEKTVIKEFSHLEQATVGKGSCVGPFARLRPQAVLEEDVKVGNFVEIKKSRLLRGVKAGHLSYLGDAEIGPESNIGAGTITCNYDGNTKHKTTIKGGAFIGSNSSLVAPVTIGQGALVGAGSVITKDVPDQTLALTRAPQKSLRRRAPDSGAQKE